MSVGAKKKLAPVIPLFTKPKRSLAYQDHEEKCEAFSAAYEKITQLTHWDGKEAWHPERTTQEQRQGALRQIGVALELLGWLIGDLVRGRMQDEYPNAWSVKAEALRREKALRLTYLSVRIEAYEDKQSAALAQVIPFPRRHRRRRGSK